MLQGARSNSTGEVKSIQRGIEPLAMPVLGLEPGRRTPILGVLVPRTSSFSANTTKPIRCRPRSGQSRGAEIAGGQEYLLRTLKEGDCFGRKLAVMDLRPRSASVCAVEDCTAIRLSAANLYQVYAQDLKQFALIQMNMGREVSRRLRESDNRLFSAKMETPGADIDHVSGRLKMRRRQIEDGARYVGFWHFSGLSNCADESSAWRSSRKKKSFVGPTTDTDEPRIGVRRPESRRKRASLPGVEARFMPWPRFPTGMS